MPRPSRYDVSHVHLRHSFDTLPETNIAPENPWLEDEISFWNGLFSGSMFVSGSVTLSKHRLIIPMIHQSELFGHL